jgi:hypothetical protein
MNYDTSTNTILDSDSLENDEKLLTPLMSFAREVLLYENEAIYEQYSVKAVPSPPDEIKDLCVDNLVEKVARCCRESKVGKKLPTAFYVHVSALQALNPVLGIYENCARRTIENIDEATLVKFSLQQPKISYLFTRISIQMLTLLCKPASKLIWKQGKLNISITATAKIPRFCTARKLL